MRSATRFGSVVAGLTVIASLTPMPSRAAASTGLVDQFQLVGTEQNQAICCSAEFPALARGQSFTVGVAGTLSGLELSLFAIGNPSDLNVSVLNMFGGDPRTAPVLGTVSVSASNVGPAVSTLTLESVTATYIDLAPLGISVQPGDALAFRLTAASPLPSLWAIQTSIFTDRYPGGAYFAVASDGSLAFFGDAAFKTFVQPPALQVSIDIKPGNAFNSIAMTDEGLLPVAILGSANLDVTQISPNSIALGNVSLATRGSSRAPKLAYAFVDVNGDARQDLIAFFDVQTLISIGALGPSTTALSLSAMLLDGTPIQGTDSISVVH